MTLSAPDDRPAPRGRASLAETAIKLVYAITAVPVALWCLFVFWGMAKQDYDGESLSASLPFLLRALIVPALWIVGVAGSRARARTGKRWLPWAIGFLVPLVLAIAYIVGTFVTSAMNSGHATQMGA